MLQERRQRRTWVAIAASVALHVALIIFMVLQKAPPARVASQPAVAEIKWIDAKPQAALTSLEQPVRSPPREPTKKTASAVPRSAAAAPVLSDSPNLPMTARDDAPTMAQAGKKSAVFTPGIGMVMRLPEAAGAETAHGETIHNDPSELPDQVAVNDYTSEKLSRRIGDELSQDAAHARAGAGNVPGFFQAAQRSMQSRAEKDKDKIKRSERSAGDSVKDVAKLFAPGVPSIEAVNKVADSPLGQSVMNRQIGTGTSVDAQRFREAGLQQMAWTQTVIDRVSAVQLRTVLEFVQDSRGVLAEVTVVEKSGDPVFDDSVMHFGRKIMRELPESDDKQLGTKWWRSRWQFTWEPPNVRVKLMEAWPIAAPAVLQ